MKKSFVIICCAIAVLSFILGCLVGGLIGSRKDTSIVGVYKGTDLLGKEIEIVFNKDGTYQHSSGSSGTWIKDGDEVVMLSDKTSDTSIVIPITAEIIGDGEGLMIQYMYYEKVS